MINKFSLQPAPCTFIMSDFTAVITVGAAAADSLSAVGAGLNYQKKEDKAHWSDYQHRLWHLALHKCSTDLLFLAHLC